MKKKRTRARSPLIEAVLARDALRVRASVDAGCSVDDRDSDGRSPLHHACIQSQDEIAELLLSRGARPDVADHEGWTPLHYAAQNFAVEVARKLVQAGAHVDACDANGNTPLFRAVFESRGRGEMIKLLLEAGADRERANDYGISPIALATTIANYDVKQWFMR